MKKDKRLIPDRKPTPEFPLKARTSKRSNFIWSILFISLLVLQIFYFRIEILYFLIFSLVYLNLYLILTNALQHISEKFDNLLNFFIQLSITFIAVFLAFNLSSVEKDKDETNLYVGLLNNTKTDVSSTLANMNAMLKSSFKDSTINTNRFKRNIFPYPTAFDYLVNSGLFLYKVSNPALRAILAERYNLNNNKSSLEQIISRLPFEDTLKLESSVVQQLVYYFTNYLTSLLLIIKTLEQEIKYQTHEIDDVKLKSVLDSIATAYGHFNTTF